MVDPRSGRTEAAAAGRGGVSRNNSTDAGRMLAGGEHRALIAASCLHPQTSAEYPSAEKPPWPRGYIPLLPMGPWLE